MTLAHPATDGDILAETVRLAPAVIALDAPLTLPGAVAAALAGAPWSGHDSPYTRAAERDPIWRMLGARPLPVSFLGGIDVSRDSAGGASARGIARCDTDRGVPDSDAAGVGARSAGDGLGAKTVVDARRATQSTLAAWVAGLPSVEAGPLDADALDAVAAALTAASFVDGAGAAVGNPTEGCIIVMDAARFAARFARTDETAGGESFHG